MLGLVRAMRYHGHAKLRLPSASLSLPAAPLCLAPCGSRSNSRGSLLSEVSLRMDGHTGLTWECFLFSVGDWRMGCNCRLRWCDDTGALRRNAQLLRAGDVTCRSPARPPSPDSTIY